ncbi:glycosyl hydrolase, partial [Saccharothrix sp. MB29]|nr:glycosyl hydrolase [Saccharothrix sp. MB29]
MTNRTTDAAAPPVERAVPPWRDARLPVADRVEALVSEMTLREKLAQHVGVWVGADPEGGEVAPHQNEMTGDPVDWTEVIAAGLGQLTRPFGTRPVDPVAGARSLAVSQEQVVAANRFGIPALVHEECLTGFAAFRATAFPAPLSWGASFDPALVAEVSGLIGASMRAAGVHQGLDPVSDRQAR